MVTKEEWMTAFELEHGRKPIPKEFVDARKNGEFIVVNKEVQAEIVTIDESATDDIPDEATFEEAFPNEPIFEEDASKIEYTQNDDVSGSKVFCFNCGKANSSMVENCVSCGSKIKKTTEAKSFLSGLTSKISEVSALATQKTKELTQNAQANTQIYTEKKKRDNLIQALGNAFYEMNKNQETSEFQELIDEIKSIDSTIQNLKDSISTN
ncbi:TPA: hypothetical protein ACGO5H_001654 [Streptococcus suis]|nr:hypothetical protein [Streptococcus suis]